MKFKFLKQKNWLLKIIVKFNKVRLNKTLILGKTCFNLKIEKQYY